MKRKGLYEIWELYRDPGAFDGREISVAGWARNIRVSKNVGFIELNDGSIFRNLQVVLDAEKTENFRDLTSQNVGASFCCRGVISLTPGTQQPFEMRATEVTVEGESSPEYPLQKKRHSFEYLRTLTYLRPRTNTFSAVFRIRSCAAQGLHKFFTDNGFVYVNTPIVTASDCEGAGEMFRITSMDMENLPRTEDGKVDYSKDFFGKPANLTFSCQPNAECFALAFGKVYTFGPTFRAEHSNTTRHAAEFWMLEPEVAFADLEDDMALEEAMLKSVISYVMEKCPADLEFLNKFVDNTLLDRLKNVVENDFARVTYTEAIDLLQKSGNAFDFKPYWGCDIQTEHERYLAETVFGRPVFVTDYPAEIKAFYMRQNDDGKTVAAVDLLVPGIGELIGGSQREERLERLDAAIEKFGLRQEDYSWYRDLRRWGGATHSGFGLGFERLIMYITGMGNIRDVEAFPRTMGNAEF